MRTTCMGTACLPSSTGSFPISSPAPSASWTSAIIWRCPAAHAVAFVMLSPSPAAIMAGVCALKPQFRSTAPGEQASFKLPMEHRRVRAVALSSGTRGKWTRNDVEVAIRPTVLAHRGKVGPATVNDARTRHSPETTTAHAAKMPL